jgi:hypothetical protein
MGMDHLTSTTVCHGHCLGLLPAAGSLHKQQSSREQIQYEQSYLFTVPFSTADRKTQQEQWKSKKHTVVISQCYNKLNSQNVITEFKTFYLPICTPRHQLINFGFTQHNFTTYLSRRHYGSSRMWKMMFFLLWMIYWWWTKIQLDPILTTSV